MTPTNLRAADWRDHAWIAWDKTVPAVMQKGPIGTDDEVREWVRMRENERRNDSSCKWEVAIPDAFEERLQARAVERGILVWSTKGKYGVRVQRKL